MSVNIVYKNSLTKKKMSNHILFVDEKFNTLSFKKHLLEKEYSYILDLLKTSDLKKKILSFDISSKKKIILISLKNNISSSEVEKLGAKFYDLYKDLKHQREDA